MDTLLFVYGTLKEPEVQMKIVGKILEGEPDSLKNHATEQITLGEGTYPILVSAVGRRVRGLALKVLEEDLPALDRYETDAYERVEVQLESGKTAWVYKKRNGT